MTHYADKLPRPKANPRPQPHADMRDNLKEKPIVICPLKQGWLVGWFEIGSYCGFARGKGTGAARTGRTWEKKYHLPVHRLPDRRPRCIPYELDQWLIAFSKGLKDVKRQKTTGPIHADWRNSRPNRTRQSVSGVSVPGD